MRNIDDYPSASRDAFEDLANYNVERRRGVEPDARRLLRGLPHGPLLEASLRNDGAITFRIRDQREPDRQCSQRIIDADAFAALRWLLLPRAPLLLSRTDIEPERKHECTI
jgi:hypothetical protein